VAAASILGLAEAGAKVMGWAMLKTGLLIGAAVAVPLICATLTVPHLGNRASQATAKPGPMDPGAFTQVAAVDWFTNTPDRFRPGPFEYVISGQDGVDDRGKNWGYNARAEWFVPGSSGRLSTVEIAVQRWGPAGLVVWLARDAGGRMGQVLERFSNVLPPLMQPGAAPTRWATLILQSKDRPELLAGAKYWLVVEPADRTSYAIWWPTWFPNTDDLLAAREAGHWAVIPPGPQRGGLEAPYPALRKWHTKAAFAVSLWVAKEDAPNLRTSAPNGEWGMARGRVFAVEKRHAYEWLPSQYPDLGHKYLWYGFRLYGLSVHRLITFDRWLPPHGTWRLRSCFGPMFWPSCLSV
jgi:hypothetical protein